MNKVSIKGSLFLSLFLLSGVLFAQDPIGSETVTVIKPYTPEVGDANKIRESPVRADSVDLEKKPVKYSIFSVPVASTFTPSKGRATTVERARPPKVFDNYASLGFGNYTNVLAEFYSNLEVNRSDNFGIYLRHNSSQGGIDGVVLDDKFYDTEMNLSYTSRNRDLGWKTEVGGEHQLFNWYGLDPSTNLSDNQISNIDPKQNYYSVYAGGQVELYDSFFDNAEATFRHTGDSYKTAENHLDATGTFEFNIADELITTNIYADILNTKFEKTYFNSASGMDFTFMNFGIAPSLLVLRDDLTLDLGLAFFYSLDAENSDNNFYIYPRVSASYRLAGEYFTAYAGIEGDLEQNTYYNFVQQNPYVSPNTEIRPTNKEYNAYVGAKGKLSNSIGYNLRGSYISELDKSLFRRNPYGSINNDNDYTYGNSFNVRYDDVRTLSVFGEISVDVNRDFRLAINAEALDYSTDTETEAWNLPNFKASLTADYQITEKWYTGANFFYVGERKDLRSFGDPPLMDTAPETINLDSYLDLNAHLGYRFNDQLSAFVKGSNLLNNDYMRWTHFEVQGLQVLAGVTYKFDFQ